MPAPFDPATFTAAQFDPATFQAPAGPPALPGSATASGAPAGWGGPPLPPALKYVNPATGAPTHNQHQNPNFPDSSLAGKVANDGFPIFARNQTADQRMGAMAKTGRDIVQSPAALALAGMAIGPEAPLLPTLGKAAAGLLGAGAGGAATRYVAKKSGAGPGGQDLAELAGQAGGGAIGEQALPQAAGNIKDSLYALKNPLQSFGEAMGKKFKPTDSTAHAGNEALQWVKANAVPQQVSSAIPAGQSAGIEHVGQVVHSADQASSALQAQYEPWLARAEQGGVTDNPWPTIRDAYTHAVAQGSEVDTHPEAIADDLARLQNAYDHPMGVRELDALRSKTGMSKFYSRNTGDQSSALANGQDAAVDAKIRGALMTRLYSLLDPEGNGVNPAWIKRVQGQVMQMRNAAEQHEETAYAEPALTQLQALQMGVRNIYRQVSPWAHPSAAEASPIKGKSNALVSKVFGELQGGPSEMPQPSGPYPTASAQRMLGPGSQQPPSVAGLGGMQVGLTTPAPAPWNPLDPQQAAQAAGNEGRIPVFNPSSPMTNPALMRKALPAASSGIGVSGTTVPDIMGRPATPPGPTVSEAANGMPVYGTQPHGGGRAPQLPMLPAPVPGMPPINIMPTRPPNATGPAGSTPVLSTETPMPMPGQRGGRLLDITPPHLQYPQGHSAPVAGPSPTSLVPREPSVEFDPQTRTWITDPITLKDPKTGKFHTVSKSALASLQKGETPLQTNSQINDENAAALAAQREAMLDFLTSGGRSTSKDK